VACRKNGKRDVSLAWHNLTLIWLGVLQKWKVAIVNLVNCSFSQR
jgi:hypothetical protein